jgi:hypothetical protein
MADKDQNRVDAASQQENDAIGRDFDRDLDAALAKYAAVEPRAGLEERILANLRAEGTRVPDRAWWRWSVIAAVAAVVVVTLALAWRSGKPSHPVIASHPSTATQGTKEQATQAESNGGSNQVRPPAPNAPRKITAPRTNPAVVASAAPKLDQFPSPQPPSEQDLAIRRYVSDFPQEATLIAQAQEQYQKEVRQQMKDAGSEIEGYDSDQPER